MDSRKIRALEAMKMVAEWEGVSVEEVYKEIVRAIDAGLHNPDPGVRQMWQLFPCSGKTPTPDEVIAFAVEYLSGRQQN